LILVTKINLLLLGKELKKPMIKLMEANGPLEVKLEKKKVWQMDLQRQRFLMDNG
jgi:hypothetical protein